ncbi:hypothetical protein B1R94_02675 [Mycolicibacterium litorale]|nr:hypothetical protein B1R94_02675 [Mycolicibacterium litorale]
MGSSKYVGYVGGVAVAVGVGAAVAAASQGIASADTDKADSSSASDSAKVDAGPKKATSSAVKRAKPSSKVGAKTTDTGNASKAADAVVQAADSLTGVIAQRTVVSKVPAAASVAKPTAAAFEAAQVDNLENLYKGGARRTARAAAADVAARPTAAADAATPAVPWSPNPFRPMPPEPAPQDMPGPIWTLEQSFINVFPDLLKPVSREGFELGYRLTQMIPWVNLVVPLTNIITDLPNALQGDKLASQRVINNLIVTIHPVAVLYYGYNEIADIVNLEQQALDLQTWAIATAWNILDPFALLHVRGESGLPLSTTTPPPYPPEDTADTVTDQQVVLAASVTSAANKSDSLPEITLPDEPSDPLRADDPYPIGMPDVTLAAEKALVGVLPIDIQPIVRELYEASWRVSQMVPGLNAVIPIARLVPALFQAALGDRDAAQSAINDVLLTTTVLSVFYYGFDQIADLLNVEDQAQAYKSALYAQVWDDVDPNGLLHVPGHSGIPV